MLNTIKEGGKKMFGLNEESYGALLSEFRPRPITSEKEYKRALKQIEKLMTKDALSREENALYGLLSILIQQYEEEHYPIPEASPCEVLSHLMEERGIRQKDLENVIGSKGVVSEVVRGKRGISKEQAKSLAKLFHVSPSVFL
jgi:HTH-type transcriptional regulator / antitoxin HigA